MSIDIEIVSSHPLPEFPSEIWLGHVDIFRLATFIPFATDISVNEHSRTGALLLKGQVPNASL